MCNTCGCKKAESFEAETKFVKSLSNKDIDRIFRYLWDNSQMTAEYWFKKSSDAEKKKIYEITQDDMDAETFNALDMDLDRSDCCEVWVEKLYDDGKIGFGQAGNFLVGIETGDLKCSSLGNPNCSKHDSSAETFEADFDNAPYDSFDEAMSDNVSIPEKEYEIDDRDIYNPDRAAMDMIRGNRALREEMEEQGVYVGRHPGYYNDNGQWVELMEHYDDYERIPNWLQGLVGVGLVGGLTYLLTKISGSTTDAGNNTTESTE